MIEQLSAMRDRIKTEIREAETLMGGASAMPLCMALLYAVRELDRKIAALQLLPVAAGQGARG